MTACFDEKIPGLVQDLCLPKWRSLDSERKREVLEWVNRIMRSPDAHPPDVDRFKALLSAILLES